MKEYKVTIKSLSLDGKGICHIKGEEIAIPNTLPGEEVILLKEKGYYRLKSILNPSKDRVKPPCKYYEVCGGCQLQHMPMDKQEAFKQEVSQELLGSFGQVGPLVTMDHPYNYRHKIHTTFQSGKKGSIKAGLYAAHSHRVFDMDRCLIQRQEADKINRTIKSLLKEFKLSPYHEDKKKGFLRHTLIRVGYHTGEIMVVLVTPSKFFPGKSKFVGKLTKLHPEITTIVQNINNRSTSVVLGYEEVVLYGKGYIYDKLHGKSFKISARSFYQVNPEQTEKLYGLVKEFAAFKGHETVLDAYCGTGTIGLIISDQVKQVIGVELNKRAVKDAISNARDNKVKNIHFVADDAGDYLVKQVSNGLAFDHVIMDPPRSGSDMKFMKALVKARPKQIVYVSCNPVTQERDLKYLTSQGYQVKKIRPVDMFPQTHHVESICLLVKK